MHFSIKKPFTIYSFYFRAMVIIAAFVSLGCLYGCSSTWSDAKQADTYKSYQAYISDNPDGEHVAEAKKRAELRYWASIKNDTTVAAFKAYLNEFPEGRFRSQAQLKRNKIAQNKSNATKARVTGSNVIIRSNHTTESRSAGVVAKKGTIVEILDQFSSGNSKEALLKHKVELNAHGDRIHLAKGKAIRILADRNDSVRASFSTTQFGKTEGTISKTDIEAIGGQRWYKIHTSDDITGWIYGKFIEEL